MQLQTWDTCMSLIVYGDDVSRAQKTFEDWCHASERGENPVQTEIKKIVGAQLVPEFLTEAGGQQLDWPEVATRLMEAAPANETEATEPAATADSGEGFWVDVQQAVPAESARLDMESLKNGLPEDIRSALNWATEKQFLFLVSCLSPLPMSTLPGPEFDEPDSEDAPERDADE